MKKMILLAALLAVGTARSLAQEDTATTDRGVEINGVMWATRNVGRRGQFVAAPGDNGLYYDFKKAQKACPKGWRLPTREEFVSLNAAIGKWVEVKGVNGRRFGRGPGSIFLPAAGRRNDSSRNERPAADGSGVSSGPGSGYKGQYWSASTGNAADGYGLAFDGDGVFTNGKFDRGKGLTVRCVFAGEK